MKKRKVINVIVIYILIVAVCFGGYFYYKIHKFQNTPKDVKEEEVSSVISQVSNLYLFPSGESPTIATVSDPLALKGQAFFNSSAVGDKVLIFSNAGKAVLYRPSINKIIEISSIKK